jgi:hypothetical protein
VDESTALSTTPATGSATAAYPLPKGRAPDRNRGGSLADFEDEPYQLTDDVRALIDAIHPNPASQREDTVERARAWLAHYAVLGQAVRASRAVRMAEGVSNYWRDVLPGFRTAYDYITASVNARWEAVAEARTLQGFTERTYDAEGELRQTRVREDPATLARVLAARMPERYGQDRGSNVNVTVLINDVMEGR